MSRISRQALVSAVARVGAMDLTQKEQLAGELFRAQPHVFASFLVQQQLGVSLAKRDFLLDILLVCFQAMKESGLSWPLITEDEQDRQMRRLVATVKFSANLRGSLREDPGRARCAVQRPQGQTGFSGQCVIYRVEIRPRASFLEICAHALRLP